MSIISAQELTLTFGGHPLFDQIQFQVEGGDRVGILGRNGSGKTTLLKCIAGELQPNAGSIAIQQNAKIVRIPQEIPANLDGSIREIVLSTIRPTNSDTDTWQSQSLIQQIFSQGGLDPDARFSQLSAGMKRRVTFARGIAATPDILLLDEPTNHLDIDSIEWLEKFLIRWQGTLLFVTHDRSFLQSLSTRIFELDRGRLFSYTCDYQTFLRRKEERLLIEETANQLFDKKLAREEMWIRQGIEARRTRNEGRVKSLKQLRSERQRRQELTGSARMALQSVPRSGQRVIEANHVTFSYPDREVLKDFSITIQRGDKLGIIGPNGSGKSTLLKVLIGEIAPNQGEIETGTNLELAYFDQLRQQLDENKTILENVGEGRDTITINGKARNIVGYLEDFLFTRERIRAPISALSGGERNRLLLARIMAKPANLLVLDEPTNDLDIETLEVLENLLLDFSGTLLLVSHDRSFLNNLVTSTLALNGTGETSEVVGGYDEWRSSQSNPTQKITQQKPKQQLTSTTNPKPGYAEKKRIQAEKAELNHLPGLIESMELEQNQLAVRMADPAFYQQDQIQITKAAVQMRELEERLASSYQRWDELLKLYPE